MALRDPSLDGKLQSAARSEFLEKGYLGASLRKIAERAGATVGAIQSRYPSKDALFVSLLAPFLGEIETAFQGIRADYYGGAEGDLLEALKASMRRESDTILALIFDHYEDAVLLLERSAGSSLAPFYDQLVERKIAESAAFFRSAGGPPVDEALLGLLLSTQFESYRRILRTCQDRASAQEAMNALMVYHFGGWAALLDAASRKKEEA